MAKEIKETKEELEEDLEDAVEEDEISFDEEEETSGELTWKQKLILINSGILAFLFFILILFPYEEFARMAISKYAQTNNFVLDFKRLNLSFFSNKTIDHFIFQNKENVEVRAESIEIDTSLFELAKKNFKGEIRISSLNLDLTSFGIKAKTVNVEDSSLIGFDRDLVNMTGTINLQLFNGTIVRSPTIPMIDTLEGVTIKNVVLNAKKTLNSNRLVIEKGIFTLSIAKINMSGYIELAPVLKASRIELKVCPKLTEKYSAEREDIASSLQLLTKDMPDGCIPVHGTIGDPKVNMPSMQQPPSTNPPVLAPVPSPQNPSPQNPSPQNPSPQNPPSQNLPPQNPPSQNPPPQNPPSKETQPPPSSEDAE